MIVICRQWGGPWLDWNPSLNLFGRQCFVLFSKSDSLPEISHQVSCLWRSWGDFFRNGLGWFANHQFEMLFRVFRHRAIRGWSQEPLIWSCVVTVQVLLRNPVFFFRTFPWSRLLLPGNLTVTESDHLLPPPPTMPFHFSCYSALGSYALKCQAPINNQSDGRKARHTYVATHWNSAVMWRFVHFVLNPTLLWFDAFPFVFLHSSVFLII